jgi:hypothetical protein
MNFIVRPILVCLCCLFACANRAKDVAPPPAQTPAPDKAQPNQYRVMHRKQAYFGDLHLHTALSNRRVHHRNPDAAGRCFYRYAKGEPIDHVSGNKIQLKTPLDFLGVTDHSELIGGAIAMDDPNSPLSKLPIAKQITSHDYAVSQGAFRDIVAAVAAGKGATLIDPELAKDAVRSGWQRLIDAAEANYEPGKFTTFIAYEWTSMPNLANLHRNVIFRGAKVPPLPFSSNQSNRPEDLWAFLDKWRTEGDDVIAIPHNSNASKGLMFALETATANHRRRLRGYHIRNEHSPKSHSSGARLKRILHLRQTPDSPTGMEHDCRCATTGRTGPR